MKKSSEVILVAAFILAAFVVPSLNAGEPAGAARPAPLPPELALTPEQRSALQSLHAEHRGAREALRADTGLAPEEKRAQARALRETHVAQKRAVFSPGQQAALRERRAHRPDAHRPNGDRPHRPRPPRG